MTGMLKKKIYTETSRQGNGPGNVLYPLRKTLPVSVTCSQTENQVPAIDGI